MSVDSNGFQDENSAHDEAGLNKKYLENDKEQNFMEAFTPAEVSKMLNVPAGTLRDWESSVLDGIIQIPRNKYSQRYYTHLEIEIMKKVKEFRDRGLGKKAIRELMLKTKEHKTDDSTHDLMQTAPFIPTSVSPSELIQTMNTLPDRLKHSLTDLILEANKRDQEAFKAEFFAYLQNYMNKFESMYEMVETLARSQREVAAANQESNLRLEEISVDLSYNQKQLDSLMKNLNSIQEKVEENSTKVVEKKIEALAEDLEANYEKQKTDMDSIKNLEEQVAKLSEDLQNERANKRTLEVELTTIRLRIESKLREEAQREWLTQPEGIRYRKTGLFGLGKKEENYALKRDFIDEYITKNLAKRVEERLNSSEE